VDLLTKAGEVLLGWAALSVVVAVGWSCFKAHVRLKEQHIALDLQRRAWRVQRERVRLNPAN
jgi:hypothetical protein